MEEIREIKAKRGREGEVKGESYIYINREIVLREGERDKEWRIAPKIFNKNFLFEIFCGFKIISSKTCLHKKFS